MKRLVASQVTQTWTHGATRACVGETLNMYLFCRGFVAYRRRDDTKSIFARYHLSNVSVPLVEKDIDLRAFGAFIP